MYGEEYDYRTNLGVKTFANKWLQKDVRARAAVTLAAMAIKNGYSVSEFPLLCIATAITNNTIHRTTWQEIENAMTAARQLALDARPLTEAEQVVNGLGSYSFMSSAGAMEAAMRIQATQLANPDTDIWQRLYGSVPDAAGFPFKLHWADVYPYRYLAESLVGHV